VIYKEDLEFILYGLKNVKDENIGGWPDHINNHQRERNIKLKEMAFKFLETKNYKRTKT